MSHQIFLSAFKNSLLFFAIAMQVLLGVDGTVIQRPKYIANPYI